MASNYSRITNTDSETHFSSAVTGELDFSRMVAMPQLLTTFNAGDIVPIYCAEVLPHDTFDFDVNFVIRQTTLKYPTMGNMQVDLYAFFVPNRIVNNSWKTIMGENPNGSWNAASISSATLCSPTEANDDLQIPVGSIADYYGFPTQFPIRKSVLKVCNDWKFRGYLEIYNNYFRDQNYQPPLPYSKLNVFENFFHTYTSSSVPLGPYAAGQPQDNSVGSGALGQAVYGNLEPVGGSGVFANYVADSAFNMLGKPLKANRLHDYFSSGLPSPEKSSEQVFIPITAANNIPVIQGATHDVGGWTIWKNSAGPNITSNQNLAIRASSGLGITTGTPISSTETQINSLGIANLWAVPEDGNLTISVSDLRTAATIQQVYEQMSRSGSFYREFCRSFFGLDVEDPYKDIPEYLGHICRNLELYQTAQTSASSPAADTDGKQGDLAAFGYTANGGKLFVKTFLEHGYIHVFAVVRHRNVYTSFMDRSNFRLSMLDYYNPLLANVSEMPVWLREINPFHVSANTQPFNYQEAWAEYRYEPDRCSAYMRSGISGTLDAWNYADEVSQNLTISTGEWLKSNSEEVLNRSLAVTSDIAPQFKAQFVFRVDKQRAMPTYSVPGLDIV